VIRSLDEVAEAYETLSRAGTQLVLEQFIRFEKELSVIAARSPRGEVKAFPAAENIHVDNILHLSIVPARIEASVQRRAEQLAMQIAEALDVIGLIAVELFMTPDGDLFVNELAPRPHNSGHYTMEACRTSQFEQHVRAICNLPLGSTELLTPVVMANILGQHVEPLLQWMAGQEQDQADGVNVGNTGAKAGITPKIHLYGKQEAKHQRKMGHINILCNDVEDALEWVKQSNIWRADRT